MITCNKNISFKVIALSAVLLSVWICEKPAQAVSYPESRETPFAPNDVRITEYDIDMPLGYIILIEKGNKIWGAIKFLESWTGWIDDHVYSSYESWYQPDGSGDFSKENVEHIKKKAWIWGWGHRKFLFNFDNDVVHCGPINMHWLYKGNISFFVIEDSYIPKCCVFLAPTKWTDIKDVNSQDASLKWYTYDKKRPITVIPINELW